MITTYTVKVLQYKQKAKNGFTDVAKVESFSIEAKNLRKLRKFLKDLDK